ncbi:MAG: DNA repair protein RecO [Patescibacteria group bacterium]
MVIRRVEGIILGNYQSGENDRVVLLLSAGEGKVKILARGVRKINSRRLGNLETGNLVKATLRRGHSLDGLGEVETIDHFQNSKTNPTQINTMLLLCELGNRLLLEGDGSGEIYRLFFKTRQAIKNNQIKQLLLFENRLLDLIGFGKDENIDRLIKDEDWQTAQRQLKDKIEGIIERHLTSPKLFG